MKMEEKNNQAFLKTNLFIIMYGDIVKNKYLELQISGKQLFKYVKICQVHQKMGDEPFDLHSCSISPICEKPVCALQQVVAYQIVAAWWPTSQV